jgi:nitrite reductase/ring-hydroxylating ferredoxin subunit
VLLADELPENDCPPVRVKLLSERLVAIRDSEGRYGLINEFCAHRGASLWFGRNEECGLRCPYHGWKFDVTGQCVEVPSEPAESGFAKRIKLKSYPLIAQGGVLWTHMGPPETRPPLPQWEFSLVPAAQRFVSKRLQCNWLQALRADRFESCIMAASRQCRLRPAVQGCQGNEYNMGDMKRCLKWSKAMAASISGLAAMPRTTTTTGALPNTCCRRSP